ncbi:hypothetical protein HK405_015866, partial [Cladochytrium tenue]
SGLLLDAQFDACLRDLWVEAIIQDCGIIVSESCGTKLRSSAASVGGCGGAVEEVCVGMKGGSDRTESFELVAHEMLQKAGILE